jgi:hypothetical protein
MRRTKTKTEMVSGIIAAAILALAVWAIARYVGIPAALAGMTYLLIRVAD